MAMMTRKQSLTSISDDEYDNGDHHDENDDSSKVVTMADRLYNS